MNNPLLEMATRISVATTQRGDDNASIWWRCIEREARILRAASAVITAAQTWRDQPLLEYEANTLLVDALTEYDAACKEELK